MNDVLLQAGGAIAIFVAIVHGVLGETKIFAKAKIEPAWIKLMLRLIWQCGALAWASLGVLLVVAPYMASPSARLWIVIVAVVNFACAALGNAWATRGRHVGWMLMALASALAVAGLTI